LTAAVQVLLVVAAVGSLLVAGAFLVFGVMVMPALGELPADGGTRAMQSVNRVAVRPRFMSLLFGTAALCLAAGVLELLGDRRPAVLIAAVLYLGGTIGVTIAGNVPLNDALARLGAGDEPDGGWSTWSRRWTAWNSVRALTSLAAGVLLGWGTGG
jgi:uncharacterized membrane protein